MTRWYTMPVDERDGDYEGYLVPRICHDCDEPAYYDDETEEYHHVDGSKTCFLVQSTVDHDDAQIKAERDAEIATAKASFDTWEAPLGKVWTGE